MNRISFVVRQCMVISIISKTISSPYVDLRYDDMVDKMLELSKVVPEFVHMYSANTRYKIEAAHGNCGEKHKRCEQYVLEITDHANFDSKRPEIFISGALHGDERVGPLATLATARIMALGAACAVHGLENACSLLTRGERKSIQGKEAWLLFLVKNRNLIMLPATNAVGFAKRQRTENGIDPNRDFPIDTRPDACMRTVTARILNELFRRHIFQIAITFHGGMRAIAYEWGAPSYNYMNTKSRHRPVIIPQNPKQHRQRRPRKEMIDQTPPPRKQTKKRRKLLYSQKGATPYNSRISPDDASQRAVSRALSRAAGSFGRVSRYRYAAMNEIVYPVHGGMEDWAYAGSWNERIQLKSGCQQQNNKYPVERTRNYPNASLRTFAILVETSDLKSGPPNDLGGDDALFDFKAITNGHVPRNLRLALAAIDLVQPYIHWIPSSSPSIITFTIGGALTVNEARLAYTCTNTKKEKFISVAKNTAARWGLDDPDMLFNPQGAIFQVSIPSNCPGLQLVAQARLDQDWAVAPSAASPPETPPQTHLANARTNPSWQHDIDGKHLVHGQIWWYSDPYTPQQTTRLLNEDKGDNIFHSSQHFPIFEDQPAIFAVATPAAAFALSATAALGSRFVKRTRLFSSYFKAFSGGTASVGNDKIDEAGSLSDEGAGRRRRFLRQKVKVPFSV